MSRKVYTLADIKPIGKNIAFQFLHGIGFSSGTFTAKSQTAWGFEYKVSTANTVQPPRWAKVIAVGPDVNEGIPDDQRIEVGKYILIDPMMWTEFMTLESDPNERFWFTASYKVIACTSEIPEHYE